MAGKSKSEQAAIVEQQAARIAELEAALALATAPRVKVADRVGSCECDCGAEVRGRTRFVVGHDARLKSRLVAAALAGDAASEARLAGLGWSGFLTAAQERKAAKAAHKAKVAADKAAREAEVAAKDAEAEAADDARIAALAAGQ